MYDPGPKIWSASGSDKSTIILNVSQKTEENWKEFGHKIVIKGCNPCKKGSKFQCNMIFLRWYYPEIFMNIRIQKKWMKSCVCKIWITGHIKDYNSD